MTKKRSPMYLGDSVYATWDNLGRLVLYTSNGIETTNKIILEEEIISALMTFLERSLPE